MSLANLTPLALAVWQHGLRDRGAGPFEVQARIEAAGVYCDAQGVSLACRELVRAGYATTSPFGYRATMARQVEMEVA